MLVHVTTFAGRTTTWKRGVGKMLKAGRAGLRSGTRRRSGKRIERVHRGRNGSQRSAIEGIPIWRVELVLWSLVSSQGILGSQGKRCRDIVGMESSCLLGV